MADMGEAKDGAGEIELEVAPPEQSSGRRVRRAVLALSALGTLVAVVSVIIGLDDPASKVVVRSGGSEPESSISVGFTSTLPETTVDPMMPETTGTRGSSVDTTDTGSDVQGPGPTVPPSTGQPPEPTIPPTLPPTTICAPILPDQIVPTTIDPSFSTTSFVDTTTTPPPTTIAPCPIR